MYRFGQQGPQYMPMEDGKRIYPTPWFSQSGVASWNGLDQLHCALASQLGGNDWRVPPSVPRSRKRTKAGRYTSDITYEELTKYFHLPTDKACKKLGVGLTILKRLCRRFGLARWPYKRPRKSDKKNTTAISADRDDDFSKEYAPAEAMSEEQQEREIKLDASPVVDGSEVVENPNVSTDRAENDLQGPGVHSMVAEITGTQQIYNNISTYPSNVKRTPGYIGMPSSINTTEQQQRWLAVLRTLGLFPIATQGDISRTRVHQQIGSARSAFTRLNGTQMHQMPETAGQARSGYQMHMHLSNKPLAQVETPPAYAPTRNFSGYFQSNSVTKDLDNIQGELKGQQGSPVPQDEVMHHVSTDANTRDIKLLLQALLVLEQQEARK